MAEFRLIPAMLAAIALTIAGQAIPGAAKAFPAAPMEAETRPCFELLPDPAISRHCWRHYRHGHGWEEGYGYRIACDRAGPGTLARALERVPPGGVLFLIGGVRPCMGTLDIRKPVTIVGQPGWQGAARVPTLEPAEGQPCMVISPHAGQVTLVGLLIQSRHAGAAPCLAQQNRELILDGTWVRYDGDGSAIDDKGGRLVLRRSVIAARSTAPAVWVRGGLEVESSSVLATTIGVRALASEDVRIRGLNAERLDDWTGTDRVRASVGIGLDSARTGRLVEIQNSIVEGFSRGVFADRDQEVAIQSLIVRDSEYGVLSDGARLRVNGSEIEAVDVGIYAGAGSAWAVGNRIIGVRRAGVYVEKDAARLQARDNLVFADKDGCQALAVEGLDPDAQSCRPWFEAPEFYRTGRASGRAAFDDVWPDSQGALTVQSGPGL